VCTDCAGITTCFRCDSCHKEDRTWYSRTCISCSLERRLREVLDDGTGQMSTELAPLFQRMTDMANPISAMTWLNKPAVRTRLQALATGTLPLAHDGIDQMAGTQGREFLRELLIDAGLLPGRDKYLFAFESWRQRMLSSISEPDVRTEIGIYLAWRHSRDLSVHAEAGRVTASAANRARNDTIAALRFLHFVSDRGHTLRDLDQQDVDAWFASASNPTSATAFLVFAMARKRCMRVQLPKTKPRSSPGAAPSRLKTIATRLIGDESLDLADRVAGLIVVLFAQPLTRVAALEISDICDVNGSIALALGSDPVSLPEPVAALLSRYLGKRSRMNTVNTKTTFLFPGGRPGDHVSSPQLAHRLRALGISKLERQGALSYLVNEIPAAVVAKATGYAPTSTSRRAVRAGTDWGHYVALRTAAAR
jgi:hypothetical protein